MSPTVTLGVVVSNRLLQVRPSDGDLTERPRHTPQRSVGEQE